MGRSWPPGVATQIAGIDTFEGEIDAAVAPRSVAIRLADDVDLGRGGLVVGAEDVPRPQSELDVVVCWLDGLPLALGRRYLLQHGARRVRTVPTRITDRLNLGTLSADPAADTLGPNDLGHLHLRLAEPIFPDPYRRIRATGSAVLIDEATNATVAAVLMEGSQ